jgi:hypothetical protein
MSTMKKIIIVLILILGVVAVGCVQKEINNIDSNMAENSEITEEIPSQDDVDSNIDNRYLEDPKFCIEDDDCVSYTNCNNQNEPRNRYYDNSLTPDYDPNQKCEADSNAFAGNDVKCQDNICEYRRCYPLWKIEKSTSPNQGISASEHYASECTSKTSKEDCELVDVYRESTKNFGDSDGIPDCEWS